MREVLPFQSATWAVFVSNCFSEQRFERLPDRFNFAYDQDHLLDDYAAVLSKN
jgi:hypothetical protein